MKVTGKKCLIAYFSRKGQNYVSGKIVDRSSTSYSRSRCRSSRNICSLTIMALTNETLPYIKLLANIGIEKAVAQSAEIESELNTYQGKIMNTALAESMRFAGM